MSPLEFPPRTPVFSRRQGRQIEALRASSFGYTYLCRFVDFKYASACFFALHSRYVEQVPLKSYLDSRNRVPMVIGG